jgi:hypothetical protein
MHRVTQQNDRHRPGQLMAVLDVIVAAAPQGGLFQKEETEQPGQQQGKRVWISRPAPAASGSRSRKAVASSTPVEKLTMRVSQRRERKSAARRRPC